MGLVHDVLLVQKRELERRLSEKYVERKATLKGLGSNLIKVIAGPRRAGKSFFAMHALDGLGSFGYANFDDERLVELKNYDEITEAVKSVYGNSKTLLLDEIQNLPKWELFVNRLQRQGFNLVITGSNSKLLSQELATHLTGRHASTNIYTFSFSECLRLEGAEFTSEEKRENLREYSERGGYPEPRLKNLDTNDYVSTLFNSIIYKDIVKRHRVRSAAAVEDLATYLASNAATEYSLNAMSKVTRCKSVHTVEKYLRYLEEAFIFFSVNRFSFKAKEQAASNKKIYCYDNGFIAAKGFKTSPDYGRLYENLVAIELKRREAEGGAKIFWWKNPQKEEVDFVLKQGMKVIELIQVCYDPGNPKTKERETRALIKAGEQLRCKNLEVLTENYEAEETASWFGKTAKIRFTPLWKWLEQ